MGARTVRITPEDFVTPPEFVGLHLAVRAGQIGGVRCELIESGGRTRLGACFQQVPLRVLPAFQFAPDPAALLYLLNPTAGLLDGDAHLVEVSALPGARAVVTGQSANRVHPAVAGFSTQQWKVRVAAGAHLVILPGPTIPYRGCRYYQRVEVELGEGARFVWGDVWLPGRYARGTASELFQFERIVQDLEVRRAGELIYRERFDWRGPWGVEEQRWFMGDGLAAGALFVTGTTKERSVHQGEVACAVLPLASGDTGFRWCGAPTALTRALVRTALTLAGTWDDGPAWLLASNHLAPNHWFSQPPV